MKRHRTSVNFQIPWDEFGLISTFVCVYLHDEFILVWA